MKTMEMNSVSFQKSYSSVRKIKQNKLMFSSNCAACGKKKLFFIKNEELNNFNNISNNKFNFICPGVFLSDHALREDT